MINFIIKHWRAFGLGLIVLALGGFLAWQNHKIASLTRERDQARTSLATYQAALDGLQADTAAKITALEAEGGRQVVQAAHQHWVGLQVVVADVVGQQRKRPGARSGQRLRQAFLRRFAGEPTGLHTYICVPAPVPNQQASMRPWRSTA